MPRRKFDAWAAERRSCIAVVGSSGWVGAALADCALAAGFPAECLRVFTSAPRELTFGDVALQTEALADATPLGDGDWLVLHAAIIGPDWVEGGDLTEMRRRNDALMDQVFALAEGADVRRLVMVSSGAAHQMAATNPAKAAYARMKREHEDVAAAWAARNGARVLLPRIFNLGGPYMNHVRNYALGDFIVSLAQTGALRIGAANPVVRSYVHVLELADVLLDMAVDDTAADEPFDIGGTQAVELQALALAIAKSLDREGVMISRPDPTGGPADHYVGDGARYQARLTEMGRTPIGLSEIIADTMAWLRQTGQIS